MAERSIETQSLPGRRDTAVPATREEARFLRPPVDIYETAEALHVVADMPGVQKDDVEIQLEKGILTIQGRMSHEPAGQPTYSEFSLLNYYRQFQLGQAVDQNGIQAKLHQGVLTLDLPKVEEAKPHRIEVQVS